MATTTTPAGVEPIALALLDPHPDNVRFLLGNLDELTASIKATGVLQPLTVAPAADDRYLVLAGHRRLAASRTARLRTVPCLIRADLDTPEKQRVAMIAENLHRADLSPVEEAKAYQRLQEQAWSPDRIAKETGRSKATVRARLRLTHLDEPTLERVHTGALSLEHADVLVEFLGTEWYPKLDRAAGTAQWRWELASCRQLRQAAVAVKQARRKLTAAGTTILNDHANIPRTDVTRLADLVDATTGQQLATDSHATCPGHAAEIHTNTGDVTYACVKYADHGHLRDWEYAAQQRRQQRDAAIDQARQILVAAGTTVLNDHPEVSPSTWVHLTSLVDQDGQRLDPDTHATCPGHAAYINTDGEIRYSCVQPADHGHLRDWEHAARQRRQATGDPTGGSPEDAADVPAADAAPSAAAPAPVVALRREPPPDLSATFAQTEHDLAVAAGLRRDHLRTVFASQQPPSEAWLLVNVLLRDDEFSFPGDNEVALALDLLRIKPTTPDAAVDALLNLAGTQPAAAAALLAACYETTLANPRWLEAWQTPSTTIYLTWLRRTGYRLSDYEQHLTHDGNATDDEAEPVDANHAEPDASPAADGADEDAPGAAGGGGTADQPPAEPEESA